MLPSVLRITLSISIIVYYILILLFLKKKSLELKYTLLWLFAGLVLIILVIWPNALNVIKIFGIVDSMNCLYIACIVFLIMIAMSLTSIVSKLSHKIRSLSQSIAMMEKRIRELEDCENKTETQS